MQYEPISGATGNTTLKAAQEGKVIEVLAIFFQCPALTTAQLRSNTTPLTGAMSFGTSGGLNLPAQAGNEALFRTAPGEALIMNASGLLGAGFGGGMIAQYSDP